MTMRSPGWQVITGTVKPNRLGTAARKPVTKSSAILGGIFAIRFLSIMTETIRLQAAAENQMLRHGCHEGEKHRSRIRCRHVCIPRLHQGNNVFDLLVRPDSQVWNGMRCRERRIRQDTPLDRDSLSPNANEHRRGAVAPKVYRFAPPTRTKRAQKYGQEYKGRRDFS